MYDRHRPIIKWYEYDASKLVKNYVEPDDATAAVAVVDEQPVSEPVMAAAESDSLPPREDDVNIDDEVARIMAAFTNAKQDGVDSCFANIAAQEACG